MKLKFRPTRLECKKNIKEHKRNNKMEKKETINQTFHSLQFLLKVVRSKSVAKIEPYKMTKRMEDKSLNLWLKICKRKIMKFKDFNPKVIITEKC